MPKKLQLLILSIFLVINTKAQFFCADSLSSNVFYQRVDSTIMLQWHANTTVYTSIDVDQDGNPDLKFRYENSASPSHSYQGHYVNLLHSSIELIKDSAHIQWVKKITSSSRIDSTYNWINNSNYFIFKSYSNSISQTGPVSSSDGYFTSGENFFGFRILYLNDTIYGWLRLSIFSNYQVNSMNYYGLKVHSYALNKYPSQLKSIINNSDLILYPNPASDYLKIKSISKNSHEQINWQLTDLSGKEILSGNFIEPETTLNINELNAGFYFLKLKTDKESITKKISVQK
jgi:hypothetical protein